MFSIQKKGLVIEMMPFSILTLSTSGEKKKLSVLYEKYKRRLFSIALNLTRNQAMAEDAVHNLFVSALRQKKKILAMEEIDFLRWSVIVVKAKCIDVVRKNKYYADMPIDSFIETMPDDSMPVDEQVAQRDIYKSMRDCIAGLDDTSRQILEMKYVLQMSMKEIADEFGFSLAQVNSRIARARAKVKKQMGNGVISNA